MRVRNLKDKDILIEECSYLISKKVNWESEFGNRNPINLEIGMGKGDFIYNMALKYPNINFVGVEKYTSIIAKAIKKYPKRLDNLRIINTDALNLRDYFKGDIGTIYLNFSDPWPKKRQAKRRLTSEIFLDIYDYLFKNNKRIILKTDNLGLFASSIVTLSNKGYKFKEVSFDLSNSEIENVLTEYEVKFRNKGVKINYLEAYMD